MASSSVVVLVLAGVLIMTMSTAGRELAPAAGGKSELTTATATPGAAGGLTATLPGAAAGFGSSSCSSSPYCMMCLFKTVGSCLSHAFTCPQPVPTVECFVGKLLITESCFGTGDVVELGSAGGSGTEGEMTTAMPPPGSAGGELTTPAGVSALLPQDLAFADLGSSCSGNCTHAQCLLHNIGSCAIDAATCADPWELLRCLVENFFAFKDCFGTE